MKCVVVINSESFGKGDEGLGVQLMGAFLRKLWASPDKPEMIICYNSGVKLMSKSAQLLEVMHGLYEQGVEIVGCGTCIDHYGLQEQVRVGHRTNMEEIVGIMMKAEKVITV